MNLNLPPSFLPPGALVDLYLRYSSDNQSIESQERAVRAWCLQHKILIRHVFKDEAKSGASVAGRDEFLKLFHHLIDGGARQYPNKPVCVLIWSWSRFSREVQDARYFKERIRYETKINIWSITDHIPEGKFAGIFEEFQHIQDSDTRTRLITDTTRGLHDLAAQGYSSGGFPPIGYRRGESVPIGKKKNGETRYAHKWEIDADTAPRVALAWKMRLAGKPYLEIHQAARVTASAQGLHDFFKRVTYAGAIQCGDTIVWDAHPGYVTRADFEHVQAMFQTRAQHTARPETAPARKRADSPYLVSGRLRCGYCGWAMVGSLYRGVPYYRCNWRHRQGHARVECAQPAIVAHAVHDQIIELVATHILTYAELVNARDAINAALSGTAAPLHERRAFLHAEQKRVGAMISNLVTSIEKFGAVAEISERLTARRVELYDIQVELAQIDARIVSGEIRVGDEVLKLLAEEMQNELQRGEPHQVKAILHQVVQQTTLFLDKIQVLYSALPMLEHTFAHQPTKKSAHALSQTCNYSMPLTGTGLITGIPLHLLETPFARPKKGRYHNASTV